MRQVLTIVLSLSLLLGLSAASSRLLAQDEKKEPAKTETPKDQDKDKDKDKDDAKKEEPKKDEQKKEETKPASAPAPTPAPSPGAAPAGEEPLPTIPPEVQDKLDKARKAVAEAIIAAQDAGLVQTTIDPPPILDILITGRALDERQVKKAVGQTELQVGVNPEVFGAWFTGYGQMAGVNPEKNIRIVQPSKGLKDWYDQRAAVMRPHLDAARKAKGPAPGTPAAAPAEPKKDEAAKKDETPKKDEPKDESKKDESKKDESKKDESK